MDNPEKLTTQGTQDTGQINVREYQGGNQKWTIHRKQKGWENNRWRKPQDKSRDTGNIGYTRHRTLNIEQHKPH